MVVGARSKFWGLSGSEDRGGGDNSIRFTNFGRVGDKRFKEWRQKLGGGRVGDNKDFDFLVPLYSQGGTCQNFDRDACPVFGFEIWPNPISLGWQIF